MVGGKERQRGRVIDRGLHAVLVQMRSQRVATWMADCVEVIDMRPPRGGCGHHDFLDLVEAGIVDLCGFLPRFGPCDEMWQLRREDCRLQAVEPAVDALDLVLM